jgi:hypothetical protein
MARTSEIDALYALPLESFTAERNRLAKALRDRGDLELADEVAALRKPVLAAWVVNQLAREHPRDVDLLLDAGHRLLENQRSSTARERQREALGALLAGAREVLGSRASEQTLRTVAETLRTASMTEDGRALLALGRLTQPLTTTGWELVVANPPPKAKGRATSKTEKQASTRDYDAIKRATAVRDRARARLREATQAESEARRSHGRAERELEKARLALDEAETALRAARGAD